LERSIAGARIEFDEGERGEGGVATREDEGGRLAKSESAREASEEE